MQKRYSYIALGGTFDHLHIGHEAFLKFASQLAETLIIGITNQHMISKKSWSHSVQSYDERADAVRQYCQSQQIDHEIAQLSDAIGSTLTDARIEALAVTTETKVGGEKINKMRLEKGLSKLPLHVFELVDASDGQPLHSDRIRAGECTRQGELYINRFKKTVSLSAEQRQLLKKPLGTIVDHQKPRDTQGMTILVGDSTIDTFVNQGWSYHLGIYDKKIQRQPATGFTSKLSPDKFVVNPAGTIQPQLAQAIATAINHGGNQPIHIFVEGEEDLAALPSILLAPLGSHVYYGQPNQGLVRVTVTEEIKRELSW